MLPFSAGDVIMGESIGIGLCTLWTPKNKYKALLPSVQVLGNLYSAFGIGILIRNVLATPSIQTIVVTGNDNPEPLKQQADNLLNGIFNPDDLYLTESLVKEFYKRVTLYDATHIPLRSQDKLIRFITNIKTPKEDYTPILVPLPQVTQETYPTHRSGHLIRASSIEKAHYEILKEIRTFGEFTQPDSEGHRRQELWQLTVCLDKTTELRSIPHNTDEEIFRYGESLWLGNEPAELTYRYGHTMRFKYGDQIKGIIEAFKKKPETYRAIISLWEPLQSMIRDDEPCLITIHPRIRNGVLDMYAYIRTNEMFRGWPKNAAGLRYLQQLLTEELNVKIGELTITSGSAHLYDIAFADVEKHLKNKKPKLLQFDAKGDWRFIKDGNHFVGEQYSNEKLTQRFSETSIQRLERKVLPFIGSISHGVYIGKAIQKLSNL